MHVVTFSEVVLCCCVRREDGKGEDLTEELNKQIGATTVDIDRITSGKKPTDTKLSKQQLDEVREKRGGTITCCLQTVRARGQLEAACSELS